MEELLPWYKRAKIAMLKQDITTKELAEKTGMSRPYTSGVVNGRIYSKPAVEAISDALGIQEGPRSLRQE